MGITLFLRDRLVCSFPALGTPTALPPEILAAPIPAEASEFRPLLKTILLGPQGRYCAAKVGGGGGNIWIMQLYFTMKCHFFHRCHTSGLNKCAFPPGKWRNGASRRPVYKMFLQVFGESIILNTSLMKLYNYIKFY